MIVSSILELLVITVAVSYPYFTLSAYSLEYYARKFRISEDTATQFLAKLHPMLFVYFYNIYFNTVTARSKKTPAQYLATIEDGRSQIARTMLSLLMFVIILIWAVGLINRTEKVFVWVVRDITFITINLVALFLSARFGHRLKDMAKS